MSVLRPCPDCGAGVDQPHRPGCDVERCSACGGQRLGCECEDHDPAASAWSGVWPGTLEASARGWFCRMVPGLGWQPCEPEALGALPDLNRLAFFEATGADTLYDRSPE